MSQAHENYIADLKVRYSSKSLPISADIFDPAFRDYFNISEKHYQFDPEKYLEYLYNSFLKEMLPSFLNDEVQKGNVAFLLSGSLEPDVYVKRFSGQFAIVATQGLQRFVFRLLRVLSTSIQTEKDAANSRQSFKQIGYKMGEVFWWLKETKMPWGPSYHASLYQIEYASELTTVVELFFLAHEFAHMMFEVCRRSGNQNMSFIYGNEEELQADFYAAKFCYNVSTIPKTIIVAGVELALYILQGLEMLGFDMGGYPAVDQRLQMVKSAFVLESRGDFAKLAGESILARDFNKIFHWSMESVHNCNSDKDPDFTLMEQKKKLDFQNILQQELSFGDFDNKFSHFLDEGLVHIVSFETRGLVEQQDGSIFFKQSVDKLVRFFSLHDDLVPISPYFLKILKAN